MSLIDSIFDVVDDMINGDPLNSAFRKLSGALSAVSYAISIDSVTILYILLGLLALGAVAMIYVSPRFKDFVLVILCIVYPLVQTLDTLEGNDPGLLKAWFSYWVVYAFVWVLKRVCKLD